MKRLIWTVGGFCAAAAGLLVWGTKRTPSIEDLSKKLSDA
jgi:hypothetical protein